MKLFGKIRCKWFDCGPHACHALDKDIDLYVCECCDDGVVDAPASPENMWARLNSSREAGHVWYCEDRQQARVRL